jgi:hypothetical protein
MKEIKPQNGAYRTKDGKAQIEWELKQAENGLEFSAMGTFDHSCGQCIDDIAKAYPDDEMVQRINKVWSMYHLNGMQSGTPEQQREVQRRRELAEGEARTWPDAKKYFYDDALTQYNWNGYTSKFGYDSYYSWECAVLKEAGLYEVPLPKGLKATGGFPPEVTSGKRGYRFGERWVFMEIPADVLAEIASWSDKVNTAEDLGEYQTNQFLAKHGISMSLDRANTKKAPFKAGHHYIVTLIRRNGRQMRFDFWDSINNKEKNLPLDRSSVMNSIKMDINTPDTLEEFCREYGYEEESEAGHTFYRASEHARKLRAFFTSDEQEEMQDITI